MFNVEMLSFGDGFEFSLRFTSYFMGSYTVYVAMLKLSYVQSAVTSKVFQIYRKYIC